MSPKPTPPSLWLPLIKAALPGTAQAPKPGPLPMPELETLSELPAATPEARLLNQAAALAVVQRAGGNALRRSHAMPDLAPAENRPVMPAALVSLWERLINLSRKARYKPDWQMLQREMLDLLHAHHWRFPHRLLPELLEFGNSEGREDPELRLGILPLLGQRGLWLAGGPATALAVRQPWNWVIDLEQMPNPKHLSEVNPASALLILMHLRQHRPEQARELLTQAWEKLSPALKTSLLPALKQQLSLADEALLEQALDDKRREVREQAQALLGRLPGSAYVSRMQTRLWPLLSRKLSRAHGAEELELRLPSWPNQAAEALQWQRDGLDKTGFVSAAGRSLIAEMMLKQVPPASWVQQFNCSPDQLLDLMIPSDSAKHLISGLTAATREFGDQEMAAAFLRKPQLWNKNPPGKLLPALMTLILSPENHAESYLAALQGTDNGIPAEAWGARLESQTVSSDLLKAWRQALPEHLARSSSLNQRFALTLPPFLILGAQPTELPELVETVQALLLPWSEHLEGSYAIQFEEMRELLKTRHDLYHHLRELN